MVRKNNDEILDKLMNVLIRATNDGIEMHKLGSHFKRKGEYSPLTEEEQKRISSLMKANDISIEEVNQSIKETGLSMEMFIVNMQMKLKELKQKGSLVKEDEDIEEPIFEEEDEKEVEAQVELEKLSPKANKLLEKVNKLTEQIEQEKNPLKLQVLKIRIKMLVAQIDREKDLIELKENNQRKKDELKNTSRNTELSARRYISENIRKIEEKEAELEKNKRYDYESEDFLYSKDYVENRGGIEEFVKKLSESERDYEQSIAQKIKDTAQIRREIEGEQLEIKCRNEILSDIDKKHKKEENKFDFEEKRLTVVNKLNIFSRISDFFKAVRDTAKEFMTERAEMKVIDNQHQEEMQVIQEKYNNKRKELEEIYKKALAELEGKQEVEEKGKIEETNTKKENKSNENRNNLLSYVKLQGEELAKANSRDDNTEKTTVGEVEKEENPVQPDGADEQDL